MSHSASNPLEGCAQHPEGTEDGFRWLKETVEDLRANNRDLRRILGFMERDATQLQKHTELQVSKIDSLQEQIQTLRDKASALRKRNEQLEDLLRLRDNTNLAVSSRAKLPVYTNNP